MNEKQRKKLSKKCTTLRDKLIDGKFGDDIELLKYIKRKLNQDEVYEIVRQFIMKEAMSTIYEEAVKQGEYQSDDDKEKDSIMYG